MKICTFCEWHQLSEGETLGGVTVVEPSGITVETPPGRINWYCNWCCLQEWLHAHEANFEGFEELHAKREYLMEDI